MCPCRTHVAVGLVCGLGFFAISPERGATGDDRPKAVEARQADISKLPNDDLLKQANAILSRGSGDYLAAARALAGVEAQLADASKQFVELRPPGSEPRRNGGPKLEDTVNEDAAKAAVDAARSKADLARRRLSLAQTRKELQEKVAAAIESLQS